MTWKPGCYLASGLHVAEHRAKGELQLVVINHLDYQRKRGDYFVVQGERGMSRSQGILKSTSE